MVQQYRSPDIYFEKMHKADRIRPLAKVKVNVAAFLGHAERGPVHQPVRITGWRAFTETFGGFAAGGYLAYSVFGFFNNGGSECYVIRVAHKDDEHPGESASSAQLSVRDLYGKPTMRVTARNEGTWGNRVRVALGIPQRLAKAYPTQDIAPGASTLRVDVTKGFEPGAVVKITDGKRTDYAVVADVSRRALELAPATLPTQELRVDAGTWIETVEFKLTVTGESGFEIFDNLSLNPKSERYVEKVVNAQSALVRLADLKSRTRPPFNIPQLGVEEFLSGGRDGSDFVTPADYVGWDRGPGNRGGLLALQDVEEVGLICAPDLVAAYETSRAWKGEADLEWVQKQITDYCERTKTCFAILDPPRGLDLVQVREWRDRFDTKYAALYYPWIKVMAENGAGPRLVPPCGHVAGVYARTEDEVGVHRAPANEVLNDVVALERAIGKDQQDELHGEGINCIRFFRGRGIRVWGARTLSSAALWKHVNVRRLFIMVERSIDEGTQWAIFEPNDWGLWKAVERLVSAFLTGIWKEGMLVGDVPEEAYYVRCDEELNPQEVRDAGEFFCEIGLAAVRPAEFIVFRIGQRTRDIITEEPVS